MTAQTFELNHCYNMDCMEAMAAFPNDYFDLAVVDPPYFSGPERRGFYGSKVSRIGVHRDYPVSPAWEVPGKEYFDELTRVSRHYIIWGCNYFSYGFAPGRIVWDKCNQATSFSDCEIAATDLLKTIRLFRYMWSGMMQGKSISEGHIMQGNKSLNEVRVTQHRSLLSCMTGFFRTSQSLGRKFLIPTSEAAAAELPPMKRVLTLSALKSTRSISRRRKNALRITRTKLVYFT